jgi:hypothetical protein
MEKGAGGTRDINEAYQPMGVGFFYFLSTELPWALCSPHGDGITGVFELARVDDS